MWRYKVSRELNRILVPKSKTISLGREDGNNQGREDRGIGWISIKSNVAQSDLAGFTCNPDNEAKAQRF